MTVAATPTPRPSDPTPGHAGFHAREAHRLLASGTDDLELLDYLEVIAQALTSLALTQLRPPPRQRPRCASPRPPATRTEGQA